MIDSLDGEWIVKTEYSKNNYVIIGYYSGNIIDIAEWVSDEISIDGILSFEKYIPPKIERIEKRDDCDNYHGIEVRIEDLIDIDQGRRMDIIRGLIEKSKRRDCGVTMSKYYGCSTFNYR